MNRLTHERVNGIKTGYWSQATKEQLVQRLAAYENTGLEPEEIAERALKIPEQRWIPVEERLPIKEFEEGRKNGTVYDLYPCLVTRYATHTEEPRIRTYVCKSYFDGEEFMLHGGYGPEEESDNENTLAWMPLPKPYKEDEDDA